MFLPLRSARSISSTLTQVSKRQFVRSQQTSSKTPCDPLRILFFGSEQFSIASLKALHAEQTRAEILGAQSAQNDVDIESIDVVCRPGKRAGRGLQTTRYPLIYEVAKDELGLPVHEVDAFDIWMPPEGVNLIVAVSFGLLIPLRVIQKAKYGGLNVHPSMLPDLKGAAPIEHALLQRREYTGVSVQTLHPTKFDGGNVIAQTPSPGIQIAPDTTPAALRSDLAKAGASLLVEALRTRAFISSAESPDASNQDLQSQVNPIIGNHKYTRAPKITKADRRIDWNAKPSPEDILLRDRVVGRLWDDTTYAQATGSGEQKRIVYGKWQQVPRSTDEHAARLKLNDSLALVRTSSVMNRHQNHGGTFSVRLEASASEIKKEKENPSDWNGETIVSPASFTIECGKVNRGAQELAKAVMRHRSDNDRSRLLCDHTERAKDSKQ